MKSSNHKNKASPFQRIVLNALIPIHIIFLEYQWVLVFF